MDDNSEYGGEDENPETFQILNAAVTDDYLLLFTAKNGYRCRKNRNNKFGPNCIDVIPEIGWKNFVIDST